MSETQHATSASVAPPPSPELRRLEPLVGRWLVEGHALDSLAGPACAVTSQESFEWLDGGYFLVQHYDTRFGDQPPHRGVTYWGYDTVSSQFLLHFFSNNGPFTKEGNIYYGEICGYLLICTGPAKCVIALDHDGKIQLTEQGSFAAEWDLRDAAGVWRPWMRNTYRKMR